MPINLAGLGLTRQFDERQILQSVQLLGNIAFTAAELARGFERRNQLVSPITQKRPAMITSKPASGVGCRES